jgi:hypothetical protein
MRTKALGLVHAVAGVAVFAAFTLPAAAHDHLWRPHHHHHHHYAYRGYDRPLTVSRHYYREPAVYAPDPYNNPNAIVTAPVAVGSTIVSLPFRAVNAVFPAQGDPLVNPLVIVGAPVHVLGQAAQLPFYAVGSAFGAPPAVY